eukprot:scaffold43615_cov31-Tisochrysis_lutea.AAC.3
MPTSTSSFSVARPRASTEPPTERRKDATSPAPAEAGVAGMPSEEPSGEIGPELLRWPRMSLAWPGRTPESTSSSYVAPRSASIEV